MTSVEGATTAEGRWDGELWSAAALGDRVAFTELYHRHADAVWRLAMRMTGSRAVAEDVLAATFLAAWRRRADVRLVHAVLAAVAALPAGQRDVVALCLIAEVPQADAAKALGITQVTLRSRLHRARAQLRVAAGPIGAAR